jgi:hypothetical protein
MVIYSMRREIKRLKEGTGTADAKKISKEVYTLLCCALNAAVTASLVSSNTSTHVISTLEIEAPLSVL